MTELPQNITPSFELYLNWTNKQQTVALSSYPAVFRVQHNTNRIFAYTFLSNKTM